LRKGIDIRKYGSGNIGATNVTRVVGKKWGIFVFLLDFLKGFIAPFLVAVFIAHPPTILFILSGILAVCGHNWPIFLKFKGGKGVSTSLGVIAGLCFHFFLLVYVFCAAVVVWTAVFFVTKIVSLASLLAASSFFLVSLILPLPVEFKVFSFLLCAFVWIRHRENIANLVAKRERGFR